MTLYARRSWLLARQVSLDVFVVCWVVAFSLLGRLVYAVLAEAVTPAKDAATALRGVAEEVRAGAETAAALPGVGGGLRQPFDGIAERLDGLISAVDGLVVVSERIALVLGWLTFLVPVLLVVPIWLTVRIRFVLRAREAQRLRSTPDGSDLLALRAITQQPLDRLAEVSPTPLHAWRSGDTEVIEALAELQLRRLGVPSRRGPP